MKPQLAAIGATTAEIFAFLDAGLAAGRRGVLVTLTGLAGSSSRAIGSHMAVLDDGSHAGSFSAGCIEAAIAAEALDALAAGTPRTMRFGSGSPYIDVKLPCGGSIDLQFAPDPAREVIERAVAMLDARVPLPIAIDAEGQVRIGDDARGVFEVLHPPRLRLVVAGHGAEAVATVTLAAAFGAEVELLSPETAILDAAAQGGARATRLTSAAAPPAFTADRWTAVLLLFHEHEWEIGLIERAAQTDAFWIGAMGSPATHAARIERLAERGMSADQRDRNRGPVGLLPRSRDPATLALSALAEIVQSYREVKS